MRPRNPTERDWRQFDEFLLAVLRCHDERVIDPASLPLPTAEVRAACEEAYKRAVALIQRGEARRQFAERMIAKCRME